MVLKTTQEFILRLEWLIMNNRMCTLFLGVFFILAGSLIAQEDPLVNRYLTAANEQYTVGNYQRAYSYVNVAIGSFKEQTVPANVEVMAESIYYSYLDSLRETRNWSEFEGIKQKLIEFPWLSSERVTRLVRILNTFEAQETGKPIPVDSGLVPAGSASSGGAAGEQGTVSRQQNEVIVQSLYSPAELELALERVRAEAEERAQRINDERRQELLDTQKGAYELAFREVREVSGTNSRLITFALLIVGGICVIVFIIVIINLAVNLKTTKVQNSHFEETLKIVTQIASIPQSRPVLEALPPLYGTDGPVRMIGSGTAATGLPPAPVSAADKAEFEDLARMCREIGIQIDQRTMRKNNSKNVAEMVYKISQELGYGQYESTLFFSVALVYDIGFLEIDPSLLSADSLSENQKHELRNHVKQGLAQLSFVPEKYMSVFADGVMMHHENMDGTGYPEGLAGDRIPYIARVLRVAESFVALISRRAYRDIFDKESAVEELKTRPGLYDQKIVEVLERLI